MIIKSRLIKKDGDSRKYIITYRKDKRYHSNSVTIWLAKSSLYGWGFQLNGVSYTFFPREVILMIESILRGLNSNG